MKTMTFKDFIEKAKSRNLEILALKKKGLSLREIAGKFGISYERVRQIVNREKEKNNTLDNAKK